MMLVLLFAVESGLLHGTLRAQDAEAEAAPESPDASGGAPEQGDVKSLLEKGLLLYQEGDYPGAIALFEEAFARNPANGAVLSFVEKAKVGTIFQMVRDKNPKIAGIARQFLDSTKVGITAKIESDEEVNAAVRAVFESDGQDQVVLKLKHTGTFGRNLVPPLVPHLGDTDLRRRTVALTWILDIGLDAIPVLQAARKHPSSIVRTNVAHLLGRAPLRHRVSLATLKAMMEADEMDEVRQAAEGSLKTILAELNGRGGMREAKEYFLANARDYYLNPYRNPFAKNYYVPRVYTLEGERIVGERVADFQLSERMAKLALEEALELDPAYQPARVLTLCNDSAQVVEYDLNAEYYAKSETQPDMKVLLEAQSRYVDYVLRLRILASPPEVLFAGLGRALDDGRPDVAQCIVETIQATHRRGRVPQSLGKALQDPNSRLVRVAAAIAIAHANPAAQFDGGEAVISTLSEAVLTSGIRTVQRIMGEARRANRFGEVLRGLNMESYSPVESIERGYDAVVSTPPDLIIMDEDVTMRSGTKEVGPINHFVSLLRRNYRSANVPVVVTVPQSQIEKAQELYQSEERKVWVVPDTIDGLGLKKSVLDKAFGSMDDSKMRATRLATAAAEAIAHLSSVYTRLPKEKSIPALVKVLHNRPDSVRLPCIRALGDLKAGDAADELALVFAGAANPVDVRMAAMTALGKVLQGGQASPAVLSAIQAGMQESNLELRRASWYAFSNAGAPPELELLALKALPPGPGAAPPAAAKPAPAAKKSAGEAKEAEEGAEVEEAGSPESAVSETPEEAGDSGNPGESSGGNSGGNSAGGGGKAEKPEEKRQ